MVFVIPKYSRHSSGRARVTINGRTYYLGKFGSADSRQKYESLPREWLASGRSSSFGVNQENATVAELMVAYLKYLKRKRDTGLNSEARRIDYALKPMASLYAHLRVTEFAPPQLRAVRDVMIERAWARKNFNSSVRRIVCRTCGRVVRRTSRGRSPATLLPRSVAIPNKWRADITVR